MDDVGRSSWVEDAIERATSVVESAELDRTTDPKLLERMRAWELRIKGYGLIEIGQELGIAYGTAQADVKWCLENLPAAYDTADEFRRVAIPRLERQYVALMKGRLGEPPSESAHKVAVAISDQIARLLGAYAPTRLDAATQVTYRLVNVPLEDI